MRGISQHSETIVKTMRAMPRCRHVRNETNRATASAGRSGTANCGRQPIAAEAKIAEATGDSRQRNVSARNMIAVAPESGRGGWSEHDESPRTLPPVSSGETKVDGLAP